MRVSSSILPLIGAVLGLVAGGLPSGAAGALLDSSPFLPPNTAGGVGSQETAPLELRSILREGGDFEFSLYDPAKKQSTWARLNETGHDFVIKSFDSEKEILTVERRSRTYKLALKEARIIPMAVVPGPGIAVTGAGPGGATGNAPTFVGPGGPGQMGPMPVGGRGPVGTAQSLTPEQLRSLEADINRRRELRRQAAAQSAGALQPSPQPQQR